MKLQVKLFALAADLVGSADCEIDLPGSPSVGDLREELVRKWPALSRLGPHLMFAMDQQFAAETQPLSEGCEIACFPPVSGG